MGWPISVFATLNSFVFVDVCVLTGLCLLHSKRVVTEIENPR